MSYKPIEMRKKLHIFAIALVHLLLCSFVLLNLMIRNSYGQSSDEFTIKAVFIEKFTRFIEWPKGSDVNDITKPFIISVMGSSTFTETLKEIYKDKKIKNKMVEIRSANKISELEGTDAIYISKISKTTLADILAYTKDKPILTISDSNGFADLGVLINFYISDNKIKFEINETSVKLAGLSTSYMLLNLAKVVNPIKH